MHLSLVYDTRGWSWHRVMRGVAKYGKRDDLNITLHCHGEDTGQNQADAMFYCGWIDAPARKDYKGKTLFTHLAHHGCMYGKGTSDTWHSQALVSKYRNLQTAKMRLPLFTGIVAANPRLAEFGKRLNRNCRYIPSGYDPDEFFPGRRFDRSKLQVGWLGQAPEESQVDVKGYHRILLPLIESLKGENIEFDVQRRHVANRMMTDELRHWYQMTDVLVCTSLEEGSSLSPLEAMACGVCVLSTKVSDLEGLIHSGLNGILVDRYHDSRTAEATITQLRDALLMLSRYRETAIRIGSSAAATIEKERSWKRIAPQWVKFVCGDTT